MKELINQGLIQHTTGRKDLDMSSFKLTEKMNDFLNNMFANYDKEIRYAPLRYPPPKLVDEETYLF